MKMDLLDDCDEKFELISESIPENHEERKCPNCGQLRRWFDVDVGRDGYEVTIEHCHGCGTLIVYECPDEFTQRNITIEPLR
jgi:MinD superfamily P-loop ATPase